MMLHCRHAACACLSLICCGKRHKCIEAFPTGFSGRRVSLIAWQSLFQPLSACAYVSASYREGRREQAVRLNLESYRCSHQPHAMQQRFLPKAKGAEAADNRCEGFPITVNFQSVCIEKRGGAILIDISAAVYKAEEFFLPSACHTDLAHSPLDLGLLLAASERLKLSGNKESL